MATTTNIPTLVAKLQAHLAALGDGRDAKSDNERATYRRDYDTVQGAISGLMNEPDHLAKVTARIEDLDACRAAFLAKQKDTEQAIETAPDWQTMTDARARDKEQNRQLHLQRQLQLLHEGALYRAPGVTYGDLDSIDARIAELTQRRNSAQATLDGHLKAAEQVLAVTS
jgi:hypothetical protein